MEQLQASLRTVGGPLWLGAIAAIAIYLHAICWATVPPDMKLFLFPWYGHILQHGPVAAFAEPFSNYTPPYLYLLSAASLAKGLIGPLHVIKILSVAGTGFLALALANLLKALGADPKRAAFVFVLPTVVLNAALLGQCDALWAGACVLAAAAMIRGRTIACLAWYGVAIAFKAQAVFLTPFVIGALIGRRAPLGQWAIPPLVYAGLMLPAWLAGWPATDLAFIYARQAAWFEIPGNLSNPWVWASEFAPRAARGWYVIGYAVTAGAALLLGALSAKSVRKPQAMLIVALLSAMAIPFLLPKMHERYFFLADALALALALAAPSRRTLLIAATVQLASLAAMLSYIYNWPPLVLGGSVFAAIALAVAYATVTPFRAPSWWHLARSKV